MRLTLLLLLVVFVCLHEIVAGENDNVVIHDENHPDDHGEHGQEFDGDVGAGVDGERVHVDVAHERASNQRLKPKVLLGHAKPEKKAAGEVEEPEVLVGHEKAVNKKAPNKALLGHPTPAPESSSHGSEEASAPSSHATEGEEEGGIARAVVEAPRGASTAEDDHHHLHDHGEDGEPEVILGHDRATNQREKPKVLLGHAKPEKSNEPHKEEVLLGHEQPKAIEQQQEQLEESTPPSPSSSQSQTQTQQQAAAASAQPQNENKKEEEHTKPPIAQPIHTPPPAHSSNPHASWQYLQTLFNPIDYKDRWHLLNNWVAVLSNYTRDRETAFLMDSMTLGFPVSLSNISLVRPTNDTFFNLLFDSVFVTLYPQLNNEYILNLNATAFHFALKMDASFLLGRRTLILDVDFASIVRHLKLRITPQEDDTFDFHVIPEPTTCDVVGLNYSVRWVPDPNAEEWESFLWFSAYEGIAENALRALNSTQFICQLIDRQVVSVRALLYDKYAPVVRALTNIIKHGIPRTRMYFDGMEIAWMRWVDVNIPVLAVGVRTQETLKGRAPQFVLRPEYSCMGEIEMGVKKHEPSAGNTWLELDSEENKAIADPSVWGTGLVEDGTVRLRFNWWVVIAMVLERYDHTMEVHDDYLIAVPGVVYQDCVPYARNITLTSASSEWVRDAVVRFAVDYVEGKWEKDVYNQYLRIGWNPDNQDNGFCKWLWGQVNWWLDIMQDREVQLKRRPSMWASQTAEAKLANTNTNDDEDDDDDEDADEDEDEEKVSSSKSSKSSKSEL